MTNNNYNPKKLENKIMSEVKSGRIKLRSKYVFLAKKVGLNSALLLSIVLSVLFFSLGLFYMKATDSLKYLSFGKDGLLAFLESFPYLLIITFTLFLLVAGYLITKIEGSYKKPFGYFAIGLIVFVLIFGSIIAYTDVSEYIEEQAFGNHMPGIFFKPFIDGGIKSHDRGMAGRVYETDSDYLIVETPRGFEKISLLEVHCQDVLQTTDCQDQFEIGQFIIAIGKRVDGIFVADEIKIANEDQFPPMIKRGIHRQFDPFFGEHSTNTPLLFPPHLLNFDEPTNECLKQCFDDRIHSRECFGQCIVEGN